MVLKSGILRGIEDLQQRSGRVALKTSAELVDFIQHEDGISTACFSYSLNNITGEGPDIGTPMPPNIRLIVDPTKTLSHEFTIHALSDTLLEGCLSDSRATDEAQDRQFSLQHEFTAREQYTNALY